MPKANQSDVANMIMKDLTPAFAFVISEKFVRLLDTDQLMGVPFDSFDLTADT